MPSRGHRLRVVRLPATTDVNPYQRALYAGMEPHGVVLGPVARPTLSWLLRHRRDLDVLHFHWRLDRLYRLAGDGLEVSRQNALGPPAAALRLIRLALVLRLARALGVRIAWTAHEPLCCGPGARPLERWAGRLVARAADVVMAHDHASAALTRRHLRPRRPVTVVPLPSYAELVPAATAGARERIRAEVGVGEQDTLVLAFGVQRPEKDLHLLVGALAALDRPAVKVLVAGMARSEAITEMLRTAAARDRRLHLDIGWCSDQRVADLHAAADVCVLPRSRDWTSASPVLALSLGVPVVAADLRSAAELLGPGAWYFRRGDAAALAGALATAIDAGPAARAARGAAGRAHVERWSFADLAAATAVLLRGEPDVAPPRRAVLAPDLRAAQPAGEH